jgi:hypothetical protein
MQSGTLRVRIFGLPRVLRGCFFRRKVRAKRTIYSSMAFNGVNIRPTSLALAFALALGVSSTVRADDTWHNVYHSLKRFFTGSKSSPTPSPSAHHHVKHSGSGEKSAEPSSSMSPIAEDMAKAGASPAASSTPRVIVLPAAPPVVVLPAATAMREASSEATPSEATATPTPVGQTAPNPADPNPKSQPSAESGPVLRSLSAPADRASPSPQRTATP